MDLGTIAWVLFCAAALIGIVIYFVRMLPGPWMARDKRGNYPYVIADPDDEDADDLDGPDSH